MMNVDLVTPGDLALVFDVDEAAIIAAERAGLLPPFDITQGGVQGWHIRQRSVLLALAAGRWAQRSAVPSRALTC